MPNSDSRTRQTPVFAILMGVAGLALVVLLIAMAFSEKPSQRRDDARSAAESTESNTPRRDPEGRSRSNNSNDISSAEEADIRDSLMTYAKFTRDADKEKDEIENCRQKQREANARGDVSAETRWLQNEQRHLLTQQTLFNVRVTLSKQLKQKGETKVEAVKKRLLADPATPEEYRLILTEYSVGSIPSIP